MKQAEWEEYLKQKQNPPVKSFDLLLCPQDDGKIKLLLILEVLASNVTIAEGRSYEWLKDKRLQEFASKYTIDVMAVFNEILFILEKMYENEYHNGKLTREKYLEAYSKIFDLREIKKLFCPPDGVELC